MCGMILLTGATGFLGSQIARLVLRDTNHRLAVLVRGKDEVDARRRLERVWCGWPETIGAAEGRVRVICGDLSLPLLGIDATVYSELACGLTHIIHAAAELQLDGNLDALRRINVDGTAKLLELARRAHTDHGIERFAHVSTAYVAGRRTGEVSEGDLLDSYGFNNTYEQTKFEGERLVRQAMAKVPVSIFRPGMVVGDSLTGEIQSFNTVYVPLRLYLAGKLGLVPARPDMPVNIVPVDYVAHAIAALSFDRRAVGRTFHLTVTQERLPRTRDLLGFARSWAAESLGKAPPCARFVPLNASVAGPIAKRLGVPGSLLSYFSERRTYRRDNVDSLLGPYAPDWQAILPKLLEYAVQRGFLHCSGRTVHEQLVHRLQSKKLPLRIHDLAEGKSSRPRSGADMCREIGEAVGALRAMGVTSGDRVALVGLNSSRFLSLDTAIGLTGAVSVPLYYTSPIHEIEEILRASGARLLLVGAPEVLARVGKIRFPAPIASFCNAPLPVDLSGRVLSWEAFLRKGAAAQTNTNGARSAVCAEAVRREHSGRFAPHAPVGFSELATLRFTSGTTGLPKGVTFRHGQVLWLAEIMSSLLPWKARISPARYLSFLPMNHVVEGILGAYAPSYLTAPVDIFFLEDFHALSRALPRVRPTVFFSVPRFYDKVWDRFATSAAGRLYSGLPQHGRGKVFRRALRPFLRMLLLRQAGLDKCAQLIAGSAPCPEGLLEKFRELGIEIHNAYGLTEAPLVTLNRFGANRLGTVGVPLPGTQVRLAHDKEVLIRGPQVTTGYFGGCADSIIRDGWLHTGDLGEVTSEGSLLIRGRKKEILITSYGKNIHPVKIEGMLRRIPGMKEAMVVGDNRPSLSALLWIKDQAVTAGALEEIDRSICRVNGEFSHPEQVKRWAILTESPTIDNGELTGNLKLRRQAVLSRRTEVVDMLYDMQTVRIPGVLHIGEGG
jgi:long-chain acyl-CoA synthetase